MKVLVADSFERSGLEALRAAGCEVVYEPELSGDALTRAIGSSGADILVVRSTQVTEPMLDAGRLSLVVRAGAGVNTIDVAAASRRGIYVSNCPGRNSVAVAELAFGLILALDRRIPDNVVDLRAGRWNKKEYAQARGLYGRTLGLLGFGGIGQEMARRAGIRDDHGGVESSVRPSGQHRDRDNAVGRGRHGHALARGGRRRERRTQRPSRTDG
jgi:D-3-phosphoglycerate dehydrogenase